VQSAPSFPCALFSSQEGQRTGKTRAGGGAQKPAIPFAKTRIDLIALFGIQLVLLIAISLLSSPIVYFALYVLPLVT
jgi:hypothetical protein